jgi:tricorn protease
VLVLSGTGQHFSRKTWVFAVPLSGPARWLDYGPAGDVAIREGAVLVGSPMNFEPSEPAEWKRYRGGAGGKIWYSPDGSCQRVVYQRAGEIWLLESLDAEPVRLDIRLGGTGSGRAPYPVSGKSQLGSFTLDSVGQVLGAEVRGTVQWLPAQDGLARALLAEPGVRGRLPVIIPGREAVACASDNGGEDGLDVIAADGSAARRIGPGEFGRIMELAVAPDGHTAAVACEDGRLLTVALDGEPVITEIARSVNAEVAGLAFSPDSALLAWSQPWRPEFGASQIRLARLADGTVTDVTPPRFDDTSPAFTLDGRYLAFLSNRTFDPVSDPHYWDLGFLPGVRPYLVTLLATTPSPFGPGLAGSTEIEPATTGLDGSGLAERIVPFPSRPDAITSSARSGTAWSGWNCRSPANSARHLVTANANPPVISVMLAVADATAAAR